MSVAGGKRFEGIVRGDQKILRSTRICSDLLRSSQTQRCTRGMELLLDGFSDDFGLNIDHGGSLAVATGRVFLVEKTFY